MLNLAEMTTMAARSGPVGLAPDQDWPALAARRDAWRDALAAAGAKCAALYFEDTFAFTAALLGTWAAGCTAMLAGDATEITAANLADRADVFLGSFPAKTKAWIEPPAPAPAAPAAARAFPAVPVIIFTSGSTGLPLAVEKTAADLENELASLEKVLGTGLSASQDPVRVLSTVSHQHIYGLLFRCLWPLAAGRPFSDRLIRFPEELAEAMAVPGPAVLVASPAFLRRLPETRFPEARLPEATGPSAEVTSLGRFAAVYSSGGPLPWSCVPACARLLGTAPVEIYGSSETGGIAWRSRTAEEEAWTLFPGMDIAVGDEGNLILKHSPHMSGRSGGLAGSPIPQGSAAGAFATSDRIRLTAEGFHLLGRDDRIVKLEEKRLSLTAMEDLLLAHGRVAEAKVVVLPGDRETLGAVLRLQASESAEGGNAFPVRGSRARTDLIDSLRSHLLQGFDRMLLPKRWRLVQAMPANATGKTVLADLLALFEPQTHPIILDTRRLENGATVLDLSVPAELEYFRGHFPDLPLLPGVVQLEWAIGEGTRLFGPFGAFHALQAIKFQRPIYPGMRISLELARLKDKPGVSFKYDSTEGRHASGQALFAS